MIKTKVAQTLTFTVFINGTIILSHKMHVLNNKLSVFGLSIVMLRWQLFTPKCPTADSGKSSVHRVDFSQSRP